MTLLDYFNLSSRHSITSVYVVKYSTNTENVSDWFTNSNYLCCLFW